MIAPDVRTAAQAEAEQRWRRDAGKPWHRVFVSGAGWGAALVTPTREQVARELYKTCWGDLVTWEEDSALFYDYADAVLALMQRLAGDGR